MNKKIRTYEDLLEEQQRLISRLKTQEQLIKVDIAGVKEGLRPFGKALDVVNKMATRDNTAPVLNFGMEMGIDLLIRRVILARAGWFTKIVIPFLYSGLHVLVPVRFHVSFLYFGQLSAIGTCFPLLLYSRYTSIRLFHYLVGGA